VQIQWLVSSQIHVSVGNKGVVTYSPTFAINDLIHIKFCWDSSGIDGTTDTTRLYYNGVDVGSSTEALTQTLTQTSVRVGNEYTNTLHANAVIDNFKIYNYAQVNFNDIEIEGLSHISGTNIAVNPNKQLILWNTLGSQAEVEKSEVGVNGVVTGGIYELCKHGKGIDITGVSQYVDYDTVLPPNKGTVELWWKPHFDNNSLVGAYILDQSSASASRILFLWNISDKTLYFGSTNGSIYASSSSLVFSAESVNHVAGVYDSNGIEGTSDKVRLYFNKVLVGTNSLALTAVAQTGIRLGARSDNSFNANAVIDNFKIHNYAKTDFNDKDIEGITDLTTSAEYSAKQLV
jgi:hypothetical protein